MMPGKSFGELASAVGAGLAFLAIVVALIMQYVFMLEPCPLCIVQRVIVVAIGVFFVLDLLLKSQRVWGIVNICFVLLFCILGMLVAGRHVWLQHLPEDQIPACLPALGYLIETFPLYEVMIKVLKGTADCAEEGWTFMGLSIPAQVFILFVVLMIIAIVRLNFYIKRNV